MLLDLFLTFFTLGFVSFGGGYAMIPLIEHEVTRHHWMNVKQFTDVIAIAGMSPGPIATNTAIILGYRVHGLAGALSAMLGMILPTLILVLAIAMFFYKIHHSSWVKAIFYGLKPVVAGLIFFAAIRFAYSNHALEPLSWKLLFSAAIFISSLWVMLRYQVHPLYIIILSGVAGAVMYG